MKGDFSRVTFDPRNNYSQVLLQQGRVLLDSDFNELAALSAYRLRQLARDTFGPHAGPLGADGNPGFFITVVNKAIQAGAGRYYVDGLGVENTAPVKYKPADLNLQTGAPNLLYLDVWERHVTWLDKDALSEPALGGPDTTTRAQVAWRIGTIPVKDDVDLSKIIWVDWLNTNLRRWPRPADADRLWTLPQLQAWTDPQASDADVPCVADPAGGYRGLENQLYRVEIHTPSTADSKVNPTFKWSRENGSVTAAWLSVDGDDLLVEGIHDTARGFSAGQWVELTSLENEDAGLPGVMVQLAKVDGLRLTMDPTSASGGIPIPQNMDHPLVRRWDQREVRSDKDGFKGGVMVLDETRKSYPLEAGINIAFPPLTGGSKSSTFYRTGDYWLIPARPATGDILWPMNPDPTATGKDRYLSVEPAGVEHVYAPLMLVDWDGSTPGLNGKSLQLKYTPNVKEY